MATQENPVQPGTEWITTDGGPSQLDLFFSYAKGMQVCFTLAKSSCLCIVHVRITGMVLVTQHYQKITALIFRVEDISKSGTPKVYTLKEMSDSPFAEIKSNMEGSFDVRQRKGEFHII